MTETAALLVDDVLPPQPVRQWVLSLPFALRYLLATRPEVVTQVLGIVYRAISAHLIRKAGLTCASAATGAVTLIQWFGSAINLNIHFHMLIPDGVYGEGVTDSCVRFVPVPVLVPAQSATEKETGLLCARRGRLTTHLRGLHRAEELVAPYIATCCGCSGVRQQRSPFRHLSNPVPIQPRAMSICALPFGQVQNMFPIGREEEACCNQAR
jgi:hypothetical protein